MLLSILQIFWEQKTSRPKSGYLKYALKYAILE